MVYLSIDFSKSIILMKSLISKLRFDNSSFPATKQDASSKLDGAFLVLALLSITIFKIMSNV